MELKLPREGLTTVAECEDSIEELLEQTPRHSQGCHERLRIAALLGHPLNAFAKFRLSIGRLLHSNVAESVILLLVTVELCVSMMEIGVEYGLICLFHVEGELPLELKDALHGFLCEGAKGERTALVLECCEVISRTIVSIFALEMMLKVMVAPLHVLGNPWHLLDLMVVWTNLLVILISNHKPLGERISLVLRWWRMIKFLKLIEEEAELVEARIRRRLEVETGRSQSPKVEGITGGMTNSDIVAEASQGSHGNPSPSSMAFAKKAAKRGTKIGGGIGTVIGATIGAALGVIPALFTFGLSIPVFAAVGGGTGLVMGSAVET